MLLIVSYYFYCSWQPDLLYLILFTTVVSYVCGIMIEKSESKAAKKAYMLTAVFTSLSVLFFFKYFNFLAENVVLLFDLIGIPASDVTLNLILPVGISFYTFQTLSYVIDVYRGTLPAERHFGYYALYVSFFPQLVAGPIERPENLLPQLKTKNEFNGAQAAMGLKVMMIGFFKKLAVADQISIYVNSVYNNVQTGDANLVNGFTVFLATVLFAFQIYCDFSGYTDIAIGCAAIMGIKLMQNFNNPYSATTIKDFWRRWHISLTSWFTDYIYIPLGGSRCSKKRYYFNLFMVFLVSGIWHGAAWTFILWGVVHGIYQIVGNLTKKPRSKFWAMLHVNENGFFMTWARRLIIFCLVSLAWIAFRANSLPDLWKLLTILFTGWGGVSVAASMKAMEMTVMGLISAFLSIYVIMQLDKQIMEKSNDLRENRGLSLSKGTMYVYICWTIAIAWLILLSSNTASTFIYFQF
jgi:D-alanyl-lipoteichoic acid acyltransferase DltB (MBOAT superfamily)